MDSQLNSSPYNFMIHQLLNRSTNTRVHTRYAQASHFRSHSFRLESRVIAVAPISTARSMVTFTSLPRISSNPYKYNSKRVIGILTCIIARSWRQINAHHLQVVRVRFFFANSRNLLSKLKLPGEDELR